MTKADIKGKTYQVIRNIKGHAVEDIPAIREALKAQIANIPGAIMTELS